MNKHTLSHNVTAVMIMSKNPEIPDTLIKWELNSVEIQ